MHPIRLPLLLIALAGSGLVNASPIKLPDIDRMSGAPYLSAHEELARMIYKDKNYKHVDQAHREKIDAEQDEIRALLQDKSADSALSEIELRDINAAEERIAAILTDAEKDRRVCKRVHKLGSHMSKMECSTARQQEAQRPEALRQIEKMKTGS